MKVRSVKDTVSFCAYFVSAIFTKSLELTGIAGLTSKSERFNHLKTVLYLLFEQVIYETFALFLKNYLLNHHNRENVTNYK